MSASTDGQPRRGSGSVERGQGSSNPEGEAVSRISQVEAVVVGGGMAGIITAIALKRKGVRDLVVLEKSDQLGGVWHHNRYPGVACDIPAPMYAYGSRANNWSRLFAKGGEIREYFQKVAAENDLVRHVRFHTELLGASWDDRTKRWVCDTSGGVIHSRFLIVATGTLHSKTVPNIPGRDSFTGTMFHSSDWPADFDPTGKRIVVVGTGASAIQFVPEIQPHAERLVVLQRTPVWIVGKNDKVHTRVGERRALRRQRILRRMMSVTFDAVFLSWMHSRLLFLLEWMARKHLRDSVADPGLRAILTPDYRMGCTRMLLSSDFYPAITSENVDYVASGLAEIREKSVVTADGREFPVDTIIWGTGFSFGPKVLEQVRGRGGRPAGAETYLGVTKSGCPNAFVVAGLHAGSSSIPFTAECQARYIASAVETMRRQGLETVVVRPEVEAEWMRSRAAKLRHSVWNAGGCRNFYVDEKGMNIAQWPGTMKNMARALKSFDVDDYLVTRSAESSGEVSATAASAAEV